MRKRFKWVAVVLATVIFTGIMGPGVSEASPEKGQPSAAQRAYWRVLGVKVGKLQVRTVDATTMRAIPGAGCIIGETRQRVDTNDQGVSAVVDAPAFRHPRLEEMLAQLHGQLTLICYKKGYRDSINIGVRIHEGITNHFDAWMFPIGAGSRRIEPTVYMSPVHRIWAIQLADKYRQRGEGEGPESPSLSNPQAGVAPQEPMGQGVQTPITPHQEVAP